MTDLGTLELTDVERRYRDAAFCRDNCDLGDDDSDPTTWGVERTIRVEVVKAVLLRGITDDMPYDAVISVKNALIIGDLDNLDSAELPPLRFEKCHFRDNVCFDRAVFTGEARFDGSTFGGQARFAEAVFKSHARFDMVVFSYAEFYKVDIGGDAYFHEARFLQPTVKDRAASTCAHFRRARFGGDAYFRRASFEADASFVRAHFEGDAHFGALGDEPSWLEEPERSGSCRFERKALFNQVCFDNYSGFKLTTFAGAAEFYHACFSGDADFYRASFDGPEQARFERSRFKGNAEFRGASFDGPAKFNNVVFDDDANFGGNEHTAGAVFQDLAFAEVKVASQANFGRTLIRRMACFDYTSAVRMTFFEANFDATAEFRAQGLKVESLNLRAASPPAEISLKDAEIVTLEDNYVVWPPKRHLTGCAYQRLRADAYQQDPAVSENARCFVTRRYRTWYDERSAEKSPDRMGVVSRVEWLKGEFNGYDPFRYDQLIEAYRLAGDETKANFVSLAKQRERRGSLNWPGRCWGSIQDGLVGYGYRLWLPVLWLLALIAVGARIFDAGTDPNRRGDFPNFESVYYTTDLLFPLVNLGHRSSFEFHDGRVWLSFAFMLVGWLLAAAVGAGLQRLWTQKS